MKSLLIVYHSQSGSSARLARAAWQGARTESALKVLVRRVWDAGLAELEQADGLLLVMAENSGAISGGMKDFLDRTFYPAIDQGLVLPYALLVSAGNDGRGAVRDVERICRGYPLRKVAEAVIVRGDITDQQLQRAEELGGALASGVELGIF